MEILGHSQVTRTLGTYSHVMPELARDVANRMADALGVDHDQSSVVAARGDPD